MSYTIIKDYVSSSKYKTKCPYAMTPQYITVHNTANNASAKNEVSYMKNNNYKISYHVAIDDKYVVLAVPFNRNAWHAGDGMGTGNLKSIGIEICYSKSGGSKFDKAEVNAAKYIAKLLKEYGWSIKKVKRHKDWSGKDCPHRTIDYGWQRFLNMIQAELDKLDGKSSTTTSNTSAKTESKKLAVDGSWGTGTTRMTQKVLGMSKANQTGKITNQPDDNKEYLEACSESSWKFKNSSCKGGSATIKKIQKLVGVTQDGFCGKKTVTAIQNFLNKKGFNCGKADGYMDVKTVKAWQKYINSRIK